MEARKQDIVRVECYADSRALLKKLAAAAAQTIPNYLADLFNSVCEDEDRTGSTASERAIDTKLRKGDFTDTGRGKPKAPPEEFRILQKTAKDEALWLSWRKADPDGGENATWVRYGEWFKTVTLQDFPGDSFFTTAWIG